MSIEPCYRYRATLDRVIDGDTYVLTLDLGLYVKVTVPIRVRGYDAPELHGAEAPKGHDAKHAAENLLKGAKTIVVETYKDAQSFARWIADVYIDGRLIGFELIALGHAKVPPA